MLTHFDWNAEMIELLDSTLNARAAKRNITAMDDNKVSQQIVELATDGRFAQLKMGNEAGESERSGAQQVDSPGMTALNH